MDEVFFIASKTLGMAARAETWVLLVLALGLLALWRGKVRQAGGWLGTGFVALLALTVLPLGDPLLATLERRYPANPPVAGVTDIIVLGGAEDTGAYRRWGGIALNEAGERLIAGVLLARQFPQARLIFTGGTSGLTGDAHSNDPSQIFHDGWVALGVDPARIVLERASRTTSENATMTRALLQPQPGQVHLLVTSAFHMPRAMETFTRAGFTGLVPWPVDFRTSWQPGTWIEPGWSLDRNLATLDTALKEYLGLVAYRLAGK